MEKSDIFACQKIVQRNWGDKIADRFIDESWHAFYTNVKWPPKYFVYESDGKVVGFAGMMWSWIMTGVMDFIWINVEPEHQKIGIGKMLTEHRIRECKRSSDVSLIHLMTQKPAFFYKMGFGVTKLYHGDWTLMSLQLDEMSIDKE